MNRLLSLGAVVLALTLGSPLSAGDKKDENPLGKDRRLTPKDYNGYFPWTPPTTKEAWEKRRRELREQVLVACGLWPMPEKTPLKAVVHGKIDRDDYTVEKVFFASLPGHYVTGSLYRPKGKGGKLPGVLCPHGHWANGRFYDAGEKAAKNQIEQGAEKTIEGARYPLQARCAQLARMGCVVFHYDMIGVADSKQLQHRSGFNDPEADLRLQNPLGLQTWNSIRCLDFLLSLPEVDPARIGVTGASGGGTQTFILCAVDDRPAVAFPAVMVSTAMQGGCVCENAPYLRVGTGNIELAGLFAPKPLAMAGADDWTIEIETKGLPQLKELYRLYGAEDRVLAKTYKQFKHNYNQVSRELMYNWFNKHLKLGRPEPVTEKPFRPIPPKQLSVYDDEHPVPKDATDIKGLRRVMTEHSERQLAALMPRDKKTLGEFRHVIGTALRVMVNDRLPDAAEVEERAAKKPATVDGITWGGEIVSRKGEGEQVSLTTIQGPESDGTVVVLVHPESAGLGRPGEPAPVVRELLKQKATVLSVQPLLSGPDDATEQPITKPHKSTGYGGHTYGYNRSLLANRVHDILTAVAYARGPMKAKRVHLIGLERAGPWVVLARALCGAAVQRTAADLNGFRFESITKGQDEMMLPGALKYGGLPALAALCAPHELYLHNTRGTGTEQWLQAAYGTSGAADRVQRHAGRQSAEAVARWLLR
jgi:dienelactone hydrolase